jgi:hypothetical protein
MEAFEVTEHSPETLGENAGKWVPKNSRLSQRLQGNIVPYVKIG